MRSPLALGTFERQELADGFNDLSTTVELGQASNAMRRASSTLLLFNTANATMIDMLELQCKQFGVKNGDDATLRKKGHG